MIRVQCSPEALEKLQYEKNNHPHIPLFINYLKLQMFNFKWHILPSSVFRDNAYLHFLCHHYHFFHFS